MEKVQVTRQDIVKPEGQKFAAGDLVRYILPQQEEGEEPSSFEANRVGELYRVEGSYFQLHGRSQDIGLEIEDPDDEEEVAEVRAEFEAQQAGQKTEYALIGADDLEAAWAWCDEECLELVPEDEK